jgi:hypothetical protein
MARPQKAINWELVEKKMEAGCSAKEIAGSIPCDLDTFYLRFKEEFKANFSDYRDRCYEGGNANLRYVQYAKALGGSMPMLTILGRERLGQGKEVEGLPPNNDFLTLKHENMILRAELDQYKGADADKSKTE